MLLALRFNFNKPPNGANCSGGTAVILLPTVAFGREIEGGEQREKVDKGFNQRKMNQATQRGEEEHVTENTNKYKILVLPNLKIRNFFSN